MNRLHISLALPLGIAEVALMYILEPHLPMSVSDAIFFPGFAVGSVLFGHSVAMVYAGIAANVLFYSLLTLLVMRFLAHRTPHSH
jgi:hypothetical protein